MNDRLRVRWLAISLALPATAGPVGAQPQGLLCQLRDYLGTLDIDPDYGTEQVLLRGEVAWVAASSSGLKSFDISDPREPLALGRADTPGQVMDVALGGGFAYVADGPGGFRVFDVSSPAAPDEVGALDTGGTLIAVELDGDSAFVLDRDSSSVLVIDVANSAAPRLVATLPLQGTLIDIRLEGGFAYVVAGKLVHVIDVHSPEPIIVGTYQSARNVTSIDVRPGRLFVGAGSDLAIVDVSEPAAPEFIGGYAADAVVYCIEVHEDLCFLAHANYQGGVEVLNIADSASPEFITVYYVGTRSLDVQSGLALFGNQLVDVSDPGGYPVAGSLDLGATAERLAVQDEIGYVAAGEDLVTIDVSDHSSPEPIGRVALSGSVNSLCVEGQFVYVTMGDDGFEIFDVSDPAQPAVRGMLDWSSAATEMAVSGSIAYVATVSNVRVIDVSQPWLPMEVASVLPGGGAVSALAILEKHLYVGLDRGDVFIYDVSEPQSPVQLARVRPAIVEVRRIAIKDELALLLTRNQSFGTDRLYVVDVTDRANPVILADHFLNDGAVSMALYQEAVLFGTRSDEHGLELVDISDPSQPFARARWGRPDYRSGLFTFEDALFAIVHWERCEIIELVDCPECPADFDSDDDADTQDIIHFLNAWVFERAQDCPRDGCSTDLDENGVVDSRDFVAFLNAWAAGC